MRLFDYLKKDKVLALGIMSGTSVDGIDVAMLTISGYGVTTTVIQRAFINEPYSREVRNLIIEIAQGTGVGSSKISQLNFLLGELFKNACLKLCEKEKIHPNEISLIGSHGVTIYHHPKKTEFFGSMISSTLQVGEASVLKEAFPKAIVVSDFRVRDLAAGGNGAPLVPYTDYLLYRQKGKCIGLLNIGGISNITVLPSNDRFNEIEAFDTGPGNMLIDAFMTKFTNGKEHFDTNGNYAMRGKVLGDLLEWLLKDPYLTSPPPKTTGREYYGVTYCKQIIEFLYDKNYADEDVIATLTMFTAKAVEIAIRQVCHTMPEILILGGGGVFNHTLVNDLQQCLAGIQVVTNEMLGFDSDSKEAIAFAILANEAVHEICNNVPSATGARHPVIMGKILW